MSNCNKKVKVGVIGLGARGEFLLNTAFLPMWEHGLLEVTAVCDDYSDRAEKVPEDSEETE